jgi:hypothetical protein
MHLNATPACCLSSRLHFSRRQFIADWCDGSFHHMSSMELWFRMPPGVNWKHTTEDNVHSVVIVLSMHQFEDISLCCPAFQDMFLLLAPYACSTSPLERSKCALFQTVYLHSLSLALGIDIMPRECGRSSKGPGYQRYLVERRHYFFKRASASPLSGNSFCSCIGY